MLEMILGTALKTFIAELFKAVFGHIEHREELATREQLGATKERQGFERERSDATRRVLADRAVRDDGVDDLLAELDTGKF